MKHFRHAEKKKDLQQLTAEQAFARVLHQHMVTEIGVVPEDADRYMIALQGLHSWAAIRDTPQDELIRVRGIPRIVLAAILKSEQYLCSSMTTTTATPSQIDDNHITYATKSSHRIFERAMKPAHVVRTGNRPVLALAFSSSGDQFFSISNELAGWDTNTFTEVLGPGTVDYGDIQALAVKDDVIAIGGENRRVFLMSAIKFDVIRIIPARDVITSIEFNPNASELCWGCRSGLVCIESMSMLGDLEISSYRHHDRTITCVVFSQSYPNHIYTASHDYSIRMTHSKTLQQIFVMDYHADTVCAMVFLKQDQRCDAIAVSAGRDGNLLVWNSDDAELLSSVEEAHGGAAITALASTYDLIASGGWDFNINIYSWNGIKLNLLCTLESHTKAVRALKFSQSYPVLLLSCGDDKTIQCWRSGD